MILTGKCKMDFEKWYSSTESEIKHSLLTSLFQSKSNIEKYSYYISFFDFSRIIINIETSFDLVGIYNRGFDYTILNENSKHQIGSYFVSKNNDVLNTRLEATEEAIIHANKIYNETKA